MKWNELEYYDSQEYEAYAVVKDGPGTLFGVCGYNNRNSAQFIQIHDASSLPDDGAVPKIIFKVPAKSSFCYDFAKLGRYMTKGIVVCNSLTGPTKTLGDNDCWFNITYK